MDSQRLLAEYVKSGSEAAFRELVTRYLSLVYSAALRLVEGDTHRAQDVAQTVFVDLARTARTLSSDVMLGGWLHRHTCFVASKTMRGERRRQSRERQAVEMNALQNHSEADLTLIAPILDEAINQLGEADRTAVLLRFFEQRDFRSVGEALGSNEDAARMRVTRALEKLHSLLEHRGVTTTSATALGVALSANAVQAAPVGLAAAISSAAVLAGTTIATTAIITKAIAMTTLQKTLITITIAAAVGPGIYEARQDSALRDQVQTLRQEKADQFQQLERERDDASNRLALLANENVTLKNDSAELLKLRGEMSRLKTASAELEAAQNDSTQSAARSWLDRVNQLKQYVDQNPNEKIPEFQFLTDREWLAVADAGLKTERFEKEDDYRRAMEVLRFQAQDRFAQLVQVALRKYTAANNGQFPADLSQLRPYCEPNVEEVLQQLYEIKPVSIFTETAVKDYNIQGNWVITRIKRVSSNSTSRLAIFTNGEAYWQSPPGTDER